MKNTLKFVSPILLMLPALQPLTAQTRVDLTSFQTPLRDQGSRTTCIVFAAVAAVEARYKRLGQTRDLSEEFVNYLGKMFWLHQNWSETSAGGPDRTENQLGATGGGGGTGVLEWMTRGLAAPLEYYFPYRPSNYPLAYGYADPYWQSQYNSSTWNLDPANLPRAALNAPGYYYPTGFQRISLPTNRYSIEGALQNGYEVVWDFYVRGDRNDPIWRASSAAGGGAHSMLIVGYDRTSSNPNEHYFICKNSWGATSNPGGYTRIGYDYLQYGYDAAIVTGAAPTPKPWLELRVLGRRNICFDGWTGTLDVWHLPGIAQIWLDRDAGGVIDRRVGTFYDSNGTAHRVNGMVFGKTLNFWFKGSARNMRWDEQRETPTVGRTYVYTVVDGDGDALAGRHHDNPGSTPSPPYGGYARRPSTMTGSNGFLSPAVPGFVNQPEQYLGEWYLRTAGLGMTVRFSHLDDNALPFADRATYHGLVGSVLLTSSTSIPIVARVARSAPRSFQCTFTLPNRGVVDVDGWMLTWQRGVVAGLAEFNQSPNEAFYMERRDEYVGGSTTTFGRACGPWNEQPYHLVDGLPELRGLMQFKAPNLRPSEASMLAIGLSSFSSGISLSALGMTGCNLYVDPVISEPIVASQSGLASVTHGFIQPALLGQHLYSQFFVLRPNANALGVLVSNGVDVLLGGN